MDASRLIRFTFLPSMLLLVVLGVSVAAADLPEASVALVVVVGITVSFVAERIAPYELSWNESHGDRWRDAVHAVINEGALVGSLLLLPYIADDLTIVVWWPETWPFAAQVVLAVLLADMGITLVHWMSHRVGWLWRLHAVHHSVRRFYGFNGLMKHPLHQSVEALAGLAPLLLIGMTTDVAAALAACVAIQLLLQHSNVDYEPGRLAPWMAWNRAHRFHHVASSDEGDVNFGLFTSIWDRWLLRTYRFEESRRFTSADLGIAGRPGYPTTYLSQLAAPFRSSDDRTEPQPASARAAR
jgi:sterol desaturase/sphingolipid hydroxylase (fatty acid hydroxylase superfamily)